MTSCQDRKAWTLGITGAASKRLLCNSAAELKWITWRAMT